MEAREIYLFLHVLSAIVWVGGSVLIQVFGARAGRSGDQARILTFAKDMEVAGRIFTVAGFSAALWGILMVVDIEVYDWDQAWITIGLTGVVVSAVLGAAFFAPQTRKLIAQLEGGDGGAAATMRRIVVVSQAELLLLLVVVWAMTAKPGL